MGQKMSNSKGMSKTILFMTVLIGVLGVLVVPRLPEIMMALGISEGPVQQLEVGSPTIEDIRSNGTIEVAIPVSNPNSFDAKIDRISYTVYIDGSEVWSGDTQKVETVPANSETEITDSVQADLGGALDAGVGAIENSISGEETYLQLEGEVHVNIGPASFSVPFSQRKQL